MDTEEAERKRGVTIDINVKNIEMEDSIITLIDAPGHRDFVPNMMSGAAEADAAILVIDGTPNAFKAGFKKSHSSKDDRCGQTIEHI